jgi:beta-glucuronidase
LIRRDRNRASVIMWGIGNENADTDERLAFMSTLANLARAEDPHRWITAACLINRQSFTIDDRLTEQLDIIGINEYFGWYEPGFEQLYQLLDNSTPNRPVYISETGADAVTGHQGEAGQLFSETHQQHVLEKQIEAVTKASYICGIFPWLLYDFRTERRQTVVQQGWNRKGFIDKDKRTKKPVFNAVRDMYLQIKKSRKHQI